MLGWTLKGLLEHLVLACGDLAVAFDRRRVPAALPRLVAATKDTAAAGSSATTFAMLMFSFMATLTACLNRDSACSLSMVARPCAMPIKLEPEEPPC